jgi:hypothetical protein
MFPKPLDQVRRQEYHALGKGEDNPLTKTKYLWLRVNTGAKAG